MGYVFDFKAARAYAQWASLQPNQRTIALESELMINMLQPVQGESVLDVGCGIGVSALALLQRELNVTGIDPSPYMLDICLANLGQRVELYRGYAEDLPFDDNSFNHACFCVTLEYVENPTKAIEEACRVAKDKVFIGFLNRFALQRVQRDLTGFFNASLFNQARFFSIWQLKRIIRQVVGPVPVQWRTVCQLPYASAPILQSIERSEILQRCPFGAFAGMVATLVPRFRTRPLAIRYKASKTAARIAGSAPAQPTAGDHRSLHGGALSCNADKEVA